MREMDRLSNLSIPPSHPLPQLQALATITTATGSDIKASLSLLSNLNLSWAKMMPLGIFSCPPPVSCLGPEPLLGLKVVHKSSLKYDRHLFLQLYFSFNCCLEIALIFGVLPFEQQCLTFLIDKEQF